MKILLDENLPRLLKITFADHHQVLSVGEKNWLGKKNGELLGLMVLDGFDAFVTVDKNLIHQQNISRFPIMIFVLDAPNNRDHYALRREVERSHRSGFYLADHRRYT